MKNYMKLNNIPMNKTGSDFPNLAEEEYISLSGSKESFTSYNLDTDQYIFYSNVFNSFSDRELNELKNKWKIIKELHCFQVKVILYRKP